MARTESHGVKVDRSARDPIRARLRSAFALGSAAVFDAFTTLGLFMSLAPAFLHLPITAPAAFAVAICALTLAGVLDSRER